MAADNLEFEVHLPWWRVRLGICAVWFLARLTMMGLLSERKVWRRAEAIGDWIADGVRVNGR